MPRPQAPEGPLADGDGEQLVHARLETDLGSLGLSPPPSKVHLRLNQGGGLARLVLWAPCPVEEIDAWIRSTDLLDDPARCQTVGNTLSITLRGIPERWPRWTGGGLIDHIRIEPSGGVEVHLTARRDTVRKLLREDAGDVQVKGLLAASAPPDVPTDGEGPTPRQAEALAAAMDLGYYEVPRRAKLAEVSDHLEQATSTLSETLRRAEASLVETYLRKHELRDRVRTSRHLRERDEPDE